MSNIDVSTLNNKQLRCLLKNKIASRKLSKHHCKILVDFHAALLLAEITRSKTQNSIIENTKKLIVLLFGETVNSSLVTE